MKGRTKIADLFNNSFINEKVTVAGWVRTKREGKNVAFIQLNDGSCMGNLQVVADPAIFSSELEQINTGASIVVQGTVAESQGGGQTFELPADTITVLGPADPELYPLQPKKHSLEFLREIGHLRPRTSTFGAIFRVRHHMIYAVHSFFHERGFLNVHTPIITGSDAEGAGEMFRVTTLDLNKIPRNQDGTIDYSQDFFEKEANLTVSGQLEAELAALGLSEVYTFGPTFRAEHSHTSRHLAEFWMIEPEMAFYDLDDNMDLAEDFVKYLIRYALEHCREDLDFLNKRAGDEEKQKPQQDRFELSLIERLEFVVQHDFERITYTDAFEILRNSKPNKKGKFQYPVDQWGADLQSEHERFLVEKHFNKPVIVYNYPAAIKAFYMRSNDDGKTVAAMDMLFPGIGEIIGGSQREEREGQLREKIANLGIDEKELWWYLDIRKFGSAPHSGFGLGFERFIQFLTGMGNIRDVIPFPRFRGSAEF